MPVAVQSDEPGSRLRPFLVSRPPWRGQWIAEAHQRRTVLVIAVKVSSDRMRESQFSSCNISLTYRGYRRRGAKAHSTSEICLDSSIVRDEAGEKNMALTLEDAVTTQSASFSGLRESIIATTSWHGWR